MMCPPSPDRMWPRKDNNNQKFCYVQYHNYDALRYIPGEDSILKNQAEDFSTTVSKKRDCLKLKGQKIYLILGIKQQSRKRKDFFLWEYTQIEEVSLIESMHGLEYSLQGTRFLCKNPIHLNNLPDFDHFAKHTMGSFAYGMQNAINDPFSKYILDESNFILYNNIENKLEWLANFEEKFEDKNLCLTKRTEKGFDFDWFRFYDDEKNSVIFKLRYFQLLEWNVDFIINLFEKLKKQYPSIEAIAFPLSEGVLDFALAFPNITCVVLFGKKHIEKWNEVLEEFKKYKNIELEQYDLP